MAVVQSPDALIGNADWALTGYIVPEPGEFRAFLNLHPKLLPILDAASECIKRAFGNTLPLRIRIFRDRDEPACAEMIVEIITGDKEPWDSADRKLQRLHEAWLSGLARDITSHILFVTEPV